ncbi:MAG: hypothetical protein AAFQ43_12445 [Bacteroidota bacterium]
MSAPVLGLLFLIGALASGAAAVLRRGTMLGTAGASAAVAFALLTVLAFLL